MKDRTDMPRVAMQFETAAQQHEARALGMWVFLATEVLLFGGIFAAWAVYYYLYPLGWEEASGHMKLWHGAINTGVLLTSSLTMALAVHACREHKAGLVQLSAGATSLLGTVFLLIKLREWLLEIEEGLAPFAAAAPVALEYGRATELFMNTYFIATAIHAAHLLTAITLVSGFVVLLYVKGFDAFDAERIESIGLFWHLVDVIWVILFPMFYLIG